MQLHLLHRDIEVSVVAPLAKFSVLANPSPFLTASSHPYSTDNIHRLVSESKDLH
jgi:hypothetical protein